MASYSCFGLLLTLLALHSTSQILAINPGFRITITDKGLDYVLKVGIPILQKALSTTTIPDQSGAADSPIGTIKYSLSNIKLGPLSIPTSSLIPGGQGLQLKASGIAVKVSANWHYEEKSFPHISDSGSCDISVSSVSLSVTVTLGKDTAGHPTLSAVGCSLNVGHLDITFHGGASWLYNLFADNIADSLKGSLQDQLCKAAVSAINTDGNKALETLPVEVKIDDISLINYELISAPTFTSAYVETNHKGEFMSVSKPVEAPVTPPPLPAISKTDRMMYVWLTDYVANTAGYVYQVAGALAYNVTPDKVPDSSPIKLNTSSFKLILPQLYKAYPNMGMILDMQAAKPPFMAISARSINVTVPANVNVSVIADPSAKLTKPAFTIELIVYCDMKVSVHAVGGKEVITGNVTFLRAGLSLISSNIGSFDVSLLQSAANLLSTTAVIPLLNSYASRGIEIPMFDGISFLNANITLGDHYVVVSTDINYEPTSM